MSSPPDHAAAPAPMPAPMPDVSLHEHAALLRDRAIAPPTSPGMIGMVGRFPVLRFVGGGGMGVVFAARDPQQDKPVAIKLLRPELRDDARAMHRFLVEARHMQQMSHPNIMPVLEVCDDARHPHYVMPFHERGSLAAMIPPNKGLDPGVALPIARQVADALAYAHSRGLIHRDLKPANILLDGEGSAVWVCDFGLVRTMFNDSLVDARTTPVEGSAPYMSPAVARGEAEDTRCDIYSFGATLYEMLTGRPPYEGRSAQHVIHQILRGPPERIRTLKPDAHPELTKVAEGAMARELRDRYASMDDVAYDLRRIERGQRALGPRAGALGAFHVPRRWWMLGAAAALALALGAAALWYVTRPRPTPYDRNPAEIARIQCEDYDRGDEGVAYHDTTPMNTGRWYREDESVDVYWQEGSPRWQIVAATAPGEWLSYTVDIPHEGPWDFIAHAWTHDSGGVAHVEVDGVNITGPIEVPTKGYLRVRCIAPVPTGRRHLRLCFDKGGPVRNNLGGWNWIGLVPAREYPEVHATEIAAQNGPRRTRPNAIGTDPTGTRLAAGYPDGGLDLWQIKPLQHLSGWRSPAGGYFYQIEFSPDGTLMATTADLTAHVVQLWDPAARTELSYVGGWGPTPLAFAPGGTRLLVGSFPQDPLKNAAVYDVTNPASPKPLTTFAKLVSDDDPGQRAVAWFPDGTRVVLASSTGQLAVFDATTGRLLQRLVGHAHPVYAIAITPDGKQILTGDYAGSMRLWDADTGRCTKTLDVHLDMIRWVQFLDGGARARSHGDSSIITWDLTSGRPVNYMDLGGLGNLTLCPTPDGRHVVVCDDTGRFRVLQLP